MNVKIGKLVQIVCQQNIDPIFKRNQPSLFNMGPLDGWFFQFLSQNLVNFAERVVCVFDPAGVAAVFIAKNIVPPGDEAFDRVTGL